MARSPWPAPSAPSDIRPVTARPINPSPESLMAEAISDIGPSNPRSQQPLTYSPGFTNLVACDTIIRPAPLPYGRPRRGGKAIDSLAPFRSIKFHDCDGRAASRDRDAVI